MQTCRSRVSLGSLAALTAATVLAACSGSTPLSPFTRSLAGGNLALNANAQVRANALAASGRSLPLGARAARGSIQTAGGETGSHVIYSGDFDNSTIVIYPEKGINPKPIGTITNGVSTPERLFVDKLLNLYATNIGTNSITVYPPGVTSPSLTITNGVNSPTGITVGSDGTVYCANTGNNTVTEYRKGKTSPLLTIALGSETPENLAADGANNLYVDYLGGTLGSGVIKVPHGKTSGTDLNLTIGSAGALSVAHSGNLVILDQGAASLDVFRPGKTTPSKTLALGGFPFELSMNESETKVFVSNEMGSPFVIQVVDYPHLKSVTSKIDPTAGQWPLAVAPDNVP